MKARLAYTTLMSLLIGSGISNATDNFKLPYGIEGSNQLTSYQGTSNPSGNKDLTVQNADFSNASQQKVKITFPISSNEIVQIDGMVKYLGDDLYGLPHFIEYLQECTKQYKPGMKLSAEKEIVISTEDSININIFGKYVLETLFQRIGYNRNGADRTLAPLAFEKFLDEKKAPFGNYEYARNPIVFSLMYYHSMSSEANPQEPVQIVNNSKNYENLKFTFLLCPSEQNDKGKKMETFSFKEKDISSSSFITLHPNTTDTITKNLSSDWTSLQAKYQFTPFKIDEELYRIRILLSTKDSPTSDFEDRKVANFLLRVK